MAKEPILVYTDGSYRAKVRLASLGFVIHFPSGRLETYHKALGDRTSNEAELLAIQEALSWLLREQQELTPIEIYTDSRYCVGLLNQLWAPSDNKDLVHRIVGMKDWFLDLKISWVKAHSNNVYNCLADTLCHLAISEAIVREAVEQKLL